jgi:hypothetical protein
MFCGRLTRPSGKTPDEFFVSLGREPPKPVLDALEIVAALP